MKGFNDVVVAMKERMKVVVYKKPGALLKSTIILKRPRDWMAFYTRLYSANITTGLRTHLEYTDI